MKARLGVSLRVRVLYLLLKEDGSAGAVAGLLIRSGVLRRGFNSYFFRQSDDEVTLLETRLRLCLVISVSLR